MAKSPCENANPWHTLSLDVLAELAGAYPKQPMLPFMRGNILASRNRVDEAASAWQKARELGLDGPVLMRNLAIFAQHKGQKAQALEFYRQAWRQAKPDDLALFCELDRFLAKQGLHQERLEAYERLPQEARSRSMVATRRVAQQLDLGQWEAALEEMSQREIYRGELEFSNRFNYIEAILGKGVAQRMPLSVYPAPPPPCSRPQAIGGVAPGNRPVQSPRQPMGRSGVALNCGEPSTGPAACPAAGPAAAANMAEVKAITPTIGLRIECPFS
jgi:tetratricopeptide (TPR) repeat protein